MNIVGKDTSIIWPECLRSSNPSRFASTALSTRALGRCIENWRPTVSRTAIGRGALSRTRPAMRTSRLLPGLGRVVWSFALDLEGGRIVSRTMRRCARPCRASLRSIGPPRLRQRLVLHGLSPELVAEGRSNYCAGRRAQQGVADEGEKQAPAAGRLDVWRPPQVPERTEEKEPSIQSVELSQPLKRELASC